MKIAFKVLLIVLMFYGCSKSKTQINEFSSSTDKLIVRTQKQKGRGLFLLGASPLNFENIPQDKDSFVFPKDIEKIRYVKKFTNFSSDDEHSIDIIDGIRKGLKVFVVDENNNKDFTDDYVNNYQKIKWFTSDNLIKCKYQINNGKETVADSSWVNIGVVRNSLYFGRSEHLISNFKIDNEYYQIGVRDLRAGDFTYSLHSEIALLSDETIKKDTLLTKDILKLGESLNLGGNYYRFESISTLGKYITLIKENNFESNVGTQVGMIAPKFKSVTISGDTLTSSNLHDKVIVIANACGCGGDVASFQAIIDIKNTYSNKVHVIGLDSKIDKSNKGYFIDVENEFNKDIYSKYRNAYCSRTCYVIDENNKIIDKFEVTDWESNLPKLLN